MPGTPWTRKYKNLLDFLVEKTKDVKNPMSIKHFAEEYKLQHNSAQTVGCLEQRIASLRSAIHHLDELDTEAKVKIIFALGFSVDVDFLKKLEEQADVAVDEHRRITEYKKDGFELDGTHRPKIAYSDVVNRDKKIMEFLAQRSKRLDTMIPVKILARMFSRTTGVSEKQFKQRFRILKDTIYESTDFDKETKIQMLFVSGTNLPNYVLTELRKDANVKVDENNRITKYDDENLHLVKREESDESDELESDDEEKEETDEVMVTKSGRVSKKRVSYTDMSMNQIVPRKRRSNEANCSTPRVKLEPFSGGVVDIDMNSNDDEVQVVGLPGLIVPKQEVDYDAQVMMEPRQEPLNPAGASTASHYTTQMKILQAVRTLCLAHGTPSVQRKIEEKMEEIRISDQKFPISGLLIALESCVFMVTSNATMGYSVESTSLKDFLWTLQNTIMTLKFEGFGGFQKKLDEKIEELAIQDKRIPISQVISAIQTTLNIVALQI